MAIEVTDTGAGIDAATLRRMFEPYFTTKPDPGAGLGLLIVQQAVTRRGGRVEVDSTPGRGTRVTMLLPRIAGPRAEREGNGESAAATEGSEPAQ